MLVTAGSYTVMDELRETYEELVGGPASDAYALTQGLAGTLQRMEQDFDALADAARRTPGITDAPVRGAPLDELRALARSFARAIDASLGTHAAAGQHAGA